MALVRDGTVGRLTERIADLEGEVFGPDGSAYRLHQKLTGVEPLSSATVLATGGVATRSLAEWMALLETAIATTAGRYPRRYPLFVEMVADFNSAGFELPAGYASHVTSLAGNYEITLTVTGAAGASTLTVNSGPLADCGVTSAGWAAVVKHDDGTWGTHTVTSVDAEGGTLVVKPALRKPVTLGTFANLHSSVNGQHYTPNGYRAMAEHIWRYPGWKASRSTVIAQAAETTTANSSDGPWTLIEGLGSNRFQFNTLANYFVAAGDPLTTVAAARSKYYGKVTPTADGIQGCEWTVDLLGKSGYVDSYAGVATDSAPLRVEVIIDGVTRLDRTTHGLERFAVRFTEAESGTIRYTFPSGEAGGSHIYRLGTTTWWETPADVPDSLLYDGARVVYCGDSWGAYYGGVGPAAIGAHLTATGGSLVNVSVAGQTAQWAIDNFATLVTANEPDIAIFQFFVNDRNELTVAGLDTWKARIYTLIDRALAIGVQPVIIMPAATASQTQAGDLTYWAANLAEGVLP